MANYTRNYNLKKPIAAEVYSVDDANGNMNIIDEALKEVDNTVDTKADKAFVSDTTYSVDISKVGSGNNILYITIDGITDYAQLTGKTIAVDTKAYQCTWETPQAIYLNVNGLGAKNIYKSLPCNYADYDTRRDETGLFTQYEMGRNNILLLTYNGSSFRLSNPPVPPKATKAITASTNDDGSYVTPKKVADYATGRTENISGSRITDGSITTNKLSGGAVTTERIANKSVTTDKLADKSVTTDKLADKAVTGAKIETKTITNWNLNDNAIQEYAIQDGAVSNRKLSSELQSKLNSLNSANIIKNPTDSTGDIINTHLTVGDRNGIFGEHSFVSGGASGNNNGLQYCGNTASGRASASAGGTNNNATGVFSATLGGTGNTASGNNSACIGGGYTTNGALRGGPNVSKAYNSVCIGGACNTIEATSNAANSVIIGGLGNTVSSDRSACVGGQDNSITGYSAVVLGGNNNTVLTHQTKTGHYSKNGTGGSSSSTSGDAFIIGNGTSRAQSNAIRVTYTGDVYASKSINGTGADYAELREWIDGNPDNQDRCGLMVTLVGPKIRLAQSGDNLSRVGVISGNPCVVGNNYADAWHGKYKKDVFGRYIKELVHHDAVVDEFGNIIHAAVDTYDFIFADDFDPTKNDSYKAREERPEFDFMGTHGEIVTIDDGTCEADGYCVPGENGIATKGDNGFYVMERIDENHIKVFVR